ncbi:MAG TPA: hypothetical protein D7I07_05075 [Candidatus Poseidoniales archaeon]|nr:hypothetical protein [Euryarchaeota archaeon]DAC57577.1 MAG TPA: hypothetical protein D7I07_05075 [Candidatus Poseidoniales archaeon]
MVLISLILMPSLAQAHSASTFNVIIKQNDLQPSATQIEYNDSIMWYNADSRDNITHRIVFDADGDGLYNGSADWDSGDIERDCNYAGNNTTSDCQESFLVWFNGTWGVGEYNYQSIASNGEILNGTIVVIEHIEEDTGPSIGATFGSFEDDETEAEDPADEGDKRQLLLLIAGSSAIGSLLLIVLLLRRQ